MKVSKNLAKDRNSWRSFIRNHPTHANIQNRSQIKYDDESAISYDNLKTNSQYWVLKKAFFRLKIYGPFIWMSSTVLNWVCFMFKRREPHLTNNGCKDLRNTASPCYCHSYLENSGDSVFCFQFTLFQSVL